MEISVNLSKMPFKVCTIKGYPLVCTLKLPPPEAPGGILDTNFDDFIALLYKNHTNSTINGLLSPPIPHCLPQHPPNSLPRGTSSLPKAPPVSHGIPLSPLTPLNHHNTASKPRPIPTLPQQNPPQIPHHLPFQHIKTGKHIIIDI